MQAKKAVQFHCVSRLSNCSRLSSYRRNININSYIHFRIQQQMALIIQLLGINQDSRNNKMQYQVMVQVTSTNKFNIINKLAQCNTMRPLSQRSSSSSHAKPTFQTKMKPRVKGQPNQIEQMSFTQSSKIQSLNASRHNHEDCVHKQDVFNKTASKLAQTNFSHHDPTNCVCEQCQCGRHLCKFHVIKPDLSKNTVYQKSFYQQKAIPNVVAHAQEYDKLLGPHLDMNSTYLEGFTGRNGDKLQRPHPQDLLHSNGPAQNLTSYSSQFPGHKGDNQYVKPTDKHTRGYFPLRSKSTYANQYKKKQPKKDDYTYFPDQLRTGNNWFGNSTYGGFFAQPNPEYFAKKVKIVEKKEQNPDYVNQYQTTYKNDFIKKDTPICPAKIYLQTRAQGTFRDSKGKFTENTDFKAMSPNFHAISTSKHSYV